MTLFKTIRDYSKERMERELKVLQKKIEKLDNNIKNNNDELEKKKTKLNELNEVKINLENLMKYL